MKHLTVFHYDAFSRKPNKGNPAGVVLNADNFSEEEMQKIALNVGFNETVFVLKSNKATLKLKYFTPGHEINLCGHATMASLYCLKTKGLLGNENIITIETNIGVLPIEFLRTSGNDFKIIMKQDQPKFIPFNGNVSELAKTIGLTVNDINTEQPVVYGSTGTWTLLVPVKKLDKFKVMKPRSELFPSILLELPKASIHPFCMDTYDNNALMHARHFSSPYSGTIEDPVTGTASGVMGAYYLTYINPQENSAEFIVEQGQEIDRDGSIEVKVFRNDNNDLDIYIAGTAIYVKEMKIEYA